MNSIKLIVLCTLSFGQTLVLADTPPERCTGYGNVQTISLQNWEAGLGSWTVGTHDVANPATFDTPDWAVTGDLPNARAGLAAFVPNLNSNCDTDDESGALRLDSPPIVIPAGAPVPRISIDHFFATEFGWDGGNVKISVNGDGFNLVPASAIEFGSYNDTLLPALDNEGFVHNSNPLADEEAYTGTMDGLPNGSWLDTRINLLGIANIGDSIRLRFDFGIDSCGGEVGWYVDEVEFYSCEAELPPSDCGNGVIDTGEQCDDGNNFIDDGCSNTCQVDDGWECTAPVPGSNVPDHSFEDGTPNSFWTEISNNPLGTPVCQVGVCGVGSGAGPSDGSFWVWLGGTFTLQEGSVSQSVVIPSTASNLAFELEINACDSASDYFEVLIDGTRELIINGSSPVCGIDGYATQLVDISDYADGEAHTIAFHSETFLNNGGVSNFFIDEVIFADTPSICSRDRHVIFKHGFE